MGNGGLHCVELCRKLLHFSVDAIRVVPALSIAESPARLAAGLL